jgi:hypothetical protein
MCLRSRTSDKKMSKWKSKHHFLMSCQKFKKIWKTFLQEKVNLKKNLIYKNFVLNLMSKLARSTLTLPGRIRVRYLNMYLFKNCFDDNTYYLCRSLLKLDKESF